MSLRERGDDTLALFLDILGEARMALFDKAGREAKLQQRDGKGRRKIIEVRARF